MTKILLSAALIASLGAAALAPMAAQAADGTINFTGQIVAQTCKVNGANYGTPTTLPTVALPWVFAPSLATTGATAGATAFSIAITGCDPAVKKVQTLFSSSAGNINTTSNNLKNTFGTGAATNVELQILNADDNSAVLLGQSTVTGQNSHVQNLDGTGAATMPYIVQYRATGAAGAGQVKSSVEFTMVYQ
ncbi:MULTISPECIES: fimbrial protein [Dyella]|uniref:Type 1 fimbrial protein n=2 Tax=Dyella TaxID=231454 RepID=A0A4R0YJ57_9GAMM|nr:MULTISPECIES: fimbrial protein [Dyella]TBR36235.1 type 1 fimbrial protein [Dyella terrae]TCI05892.1 type 1 fimbrial protein [Dyella soli]